jgi:hypothetical protein
MAVDSPLLRNGWLTLSTADDARRSSITGTTLAGPNGSGQFFFVYSSTLNSLQVRLGSTSFTPSSACACLGILQNTPGPGEAADFGFIGYTKALAGSTSITIGTVLQPSSAVAGAVIANAQGYGPPIGIAIEAPTSTGAIFDVYINITGNRST